MRRIAGDGIQTIMPFNRCEPWIVSNAVKVAERLLAHAKLCRHIAEQSWNEETARKLDALAEECTQAAAALLPGDKSELLH